MRGFLSGLLSRAARSVRLSLPIDLTKRALVASNGAATEQGGSMRRMMFLTLALSVHSGQINAESTGAYLVSLSEESGLTHISFSTLEACERAKRTIEETIAAAYHSVSTPMPKGSLVITGRPFPWKTMVCVKHE